MCYAQMKNTIHFTSVNFKFPKRIIAAPLHVVFTGVIRKALLFTYFNLSFITKPSVYRMNALLFNTYQIINEYIRVNFSQKRR